MKVKCSIFYLYDILENMKQLWHSEAGDATHPPNPARSLPPPLPALRPKGPPHQLPPSSSSGAQVG